ncbi:MAG: hypothetical protein KGD57_04200 [Candidatus Lokiarchaeota archaeon]|nr:hypothetical protein [Candidatus Lokiarchaeota archaeon]
MKKKVLILICICVFISFSNIIRPIKAEGYFNYNHLIIDKEEYFPDEFIKINASWVLLYDQENENSYIQIRIYDSLNRQIWNSSEYHEIGVIENGYIIEQVLNVSVKNLNFSFDNNSSSFIITLFYYFQSSIEPIEKKEYYCNKTFDIKKKFLICELEGLKEEIIYGDVLELKVAFFDFENKSYMYNYKLKINTYCNDISIYNNEFIVINSNNFFFNISSKENLLTGLNHLNITINYSNIYYPISFIYNIKVNKTPVLFEIIEYNKNIRNYKDLQLKIYYYYLDNYREIPLTNHSILFQIKNSNSLLFEKTYFTDIIGNVLFKPTNNDLDFLESIEKINISIIFLGTQFLKSNSFCISFEFIKNSINSDIILFFSFFSVFAISILLIIIKIFILNKKKIRLEDITLNY